MQLSVCCTPYVCVHYAATFPGLEDVVRLPRERLRRGEGAAGLLVGITVGAGSLTRRMFHWGTRTLAGLSTTVSRAMDRLSMEDDIERLRTELRGMSVVCLNGYTFVCIC